MRALSLSLAVSAGHEKVLLPQWGQPYLEQEEMRQLFNSIILHEVRQFCCIHLSAHCAGESTACARQWR